MKTLITRIKRLALALCFVTPLVSWAATEMTNPVTGETETYANTFTGGSDGTGTEWNSVDNWDTSKTPFISGGSGDYSPSLVSGKTATTTTQLEGWTPRIGAYNGAVVTFSGGINKVQASSVGAWLTADATSSITIASFGGAQLEGSDTYPLKLSSANAGGITWSAGLTSASNTTLPFWYYLKGDGTVVYGGNITVANAQVIKQADVTLSGDSKVAFKTLVTFGSGTTATFTADAAIKIYGTDVETPVDTVYLATVNTTGETTLTEESAVGSCELVQTSTGIVLYYVDGDPDDIVAKTYTPSISVNLCDGSNPLTTAADVGFGDFAVPGTSWNNILSSGGNSSVFTTPLSTIYGTDSTGAQTLIPGASAAVSGTRGSWGCSLLASASDVRNGYADDNSTYPTPTVTISGIPYYQYKVVVYTATDAANVSFGYVTVNGTDYTYVEENGVKTLSAGTSAWGASGASNTAEALAEGVNVLVSPVTSGSTATVVGHNSSGRGCIAAVQIVEVPKTAEDGELVINVSGDTTYPVSEDESYTTVYITGVGTLAFDGEGTITTTTLNVGNGVTMSLGSGITTTTVTGSGTIVYDGALPTAGLGWTDSDNWAGTVWIKNYTTKVSAFETNQYGNENSTLRLTGMNGYFQRTQSQSPYTHSVPLELVDDGDTVAFEYNDGWGGSAVYINTVKGTGTLKTTTQGNGQIVYIANADEFTGTFDLSYQKIQIGGTAPNGNNQNWNGRLLVEGTATVAAGKTWTANGGFEVTGTLYNNGTLESSNATAVRGSGTVVFTGRYPTPVDGDNETKWWKNANWTGTVQIANKSGMVADCAFNSYGTAASTVELNNVTGYLQANFTCAPKLKVTGTLSLTNGSSGKANAFKVGTLLGSGTISGSSSAPTAVLNVTDDWSGFTGGIGLNSSKCVVFGATIPDNLAAGTIYVSEGATVEIKTSGNWWATGGIVVNGTLKASGRGKWGGGTAMVINETGVLELTSTGNVDESNSTDYNYGNVTGTGTIKFNGSGYRGFPYTSPADTLSIVAEQANGLVFRQDGKVIGSLSGTKNLRSDLGNTGKTLTIKQAKDGVWSGIFKGGTDRLATIVVAPGDSTTGTLTLAGIQDQDGWADALTVSGSVNLTGTWVGDTTVSGTFGGTGTLTGDLTFSDGATFKAFAADDDNGLAVSGTVTCPEEGTVTVDVSAIEDPGTYALLAASGLDADKFALAEGAPEGATLAVVEGVLTLTVPTPSVSITIPEVENATVAVTVDGVEVTPENGVVTAQVGATVVVTYTAAEGYKLEGTGTFNFSATDGYSIDVSSTKSSAIVARTDDDQTFTRVPDALTYAYMTTGVEVVTVIDSTWSDDGTYDEYFAWDATARTYTKRPYVARIAAASFTSLAAAIAYEGAENPIVVLLADVTLTETQTIDKNLTIDLNGHDIAATDARALWIKAGTVSITGEGEISANATENSSFLDTSSVIRVGDSAVNANAASLTIGADVTVSSGHCYGVTAFGKNTPGISLVVNGTVAVTGTASAISGNGSSGLASANITVNDGAVVSATADAGIYFPGTGTLAITGGTITGPTAVYAKCGTINITGGTLTGTAAKAAYAYNGNGLNATGDALVIDTCGYPGNPATVSVTGGTFTSQNAEAVASYKKGDDAKYADDTVNEAVTGFVSGGTFSSDVSAFCATGYEATEDSGVWTVAALPNYTVTFGVDGGTPAPAAQTVQKGSTATEPEAPTKDGFTFAGWTLGGSAYDFATPVTGDITLVASWTAVSSGIDPTDPTSSQDVTVDTSLTAEEQEAAAIEAATVTVPDGVSGVDAATYKTYFTYSATPTETAGTYTVAITGLADEVTETADGNALAALEAATAGAALGTITVKPGLYYGTAAGADVTTLKAPAGELNTTGTLNLGVTKPSTGEAYFIKIKVGTTAFAAEE